MALGGMSTYLANAVLGHILGKTSYTQPTIYLALIKTVPTAADTGTTIALQEPQAFEFTNYARQVLTSGTFSAATMNGFSAESTNSTQIDFPALSGGDAGCVISGWALVDASSAGNILWYGALDTAITLRALNVFSVLSGIIKIDLDCSTGISNYVAKKIVDHTLDTTAYTMPSIYIGLVTTAASATDTGSTVIEPTSLTYTNYARVAIGGSAWTTPSAGSSNNNSTVTFSQSGGSSSGSRVLGYILVDASSAGNLVAFGTFSVQLVSANGIPSWGSNSIIVQAA